MHMLVASNIIDDYTVVVKCIQRRSTDSPATPAATLGSNRPPRHYIRPINIGAKQFENVLIASLIIDVNSALFLSLVLTLTRVSTFAGSYVKQLPRVITRGS